MDQFISACGVAGHVLLIDCRPPFATQLVPLADPDVTLVVANSNVKHSLSGSEYPDRVRQCKEACAAMRAAGHPQVQFLRDATAAMLDATHAQTTLPLDVLKRARHGITEDARTLEAVDALKARDYTKVGALMLRSRLARDEYEVSCPELDALVEIAMGVSGVFGSRMTGGGFGGCDLARAQVGGARAAQGDQEDTAARRQEGDVFRHRGRPRRARARERRRRRRARGEDRGGGGGGGGARGIDVPAEIAGRVILDAGVAVALSATTNCACTSRVCRPRGDDARCDSPRLEFDQVVLRFAIASRSRRLVALAALVLRRDSADLRRCEPSRAAGEPPAGGA